MSSQGYGTYRRRPPPPPPRVSSSRDPSPDSGMSVSSTSSTPSTTVETTSVPEQCQNETSRVSQINSEESQLLDDICSSLDSSTLTVLSLPPLTSKVEKLRANSQSLNNLNVKSVTEPAQKPPVPIRTDSLKLERRRSNKVKLEDRFSFRSVNVFPPPPPFTNCPNTYPTKELFGTLSPTPEYKPDIEKPRAKSSSAATGDLTPRSRNADGAFFTKLFSLKPQSGELRQTNLKNASSNVSSGTEFVSKQDLTRKKKPEIAKKPTLDRRSISILMDNKPHPGSVARSQSLYSATRPQIRIHSPRMSEAGGRDKENIGEAECGERAQAVRRAPPPPPRVRW